MTAELAEQCRMCTYFCTLHSAHCTNGPPRSSMAATGIQKMVGIILLVAPCHCKVAVQIYPNKEMFMDECMHACCPYACYDPADVRVELARRQAVALFVPCVRTTTPAVHTALHHLSLLPATRLAVHTRHAAAGGLSHRAVSLLMSLFAAYMERELAAARVTAPVQHAACAARQPGHPPCHAGRPPCPAAAAAACGSSWHRLPGPPRPLRPPRANGHGTASKQGGPARSRDPRRHAHREL